MMPEHISRFRERGQFTPEQSSDERHFMVNLLIRRYLSKLDSDYSSRIETLEDEVYDIKEEIRKLKKGSIENPLSFLSKKLSLYGKFAVLKKETYDVLLITNSEREAFNFSLKKIDSMILRLK